MADLFPSESPEIERGQAAPADPGDLFPSAEPVNVPVRAQESSGGLRSFFTGEGRTEFEDMPEFDLPAMMALQEPGATARTAIGLMATMDPERQVRVLQSNFPDMKFSEDRYGNVIVDAQAYGGGRGYLNKPGASMRDATQAAGLMAAFTPAGRAGNLVSGVFKRMLATGSASAATQAGVDLAGQAAGGEEDVSVENIEGGDVAIAGFGGGLFEGLGQVIRAMLPSFRRSQTVTDPIRQEFIQAAKRAGVPENEITDDLIASWLRAADQAQTLSDDTSAIAVQQMDEFGIPYTRGQSMKPGGEKAAQLSREDTLRNTTASPRANEIMARGDAARASAISQAKEGLQSSVAGSDDLINRPNQAGAILREGVQGREAAARSAVDHAYGEVGDASLTPEGMSGVLSTLRRVATQNNFVRSPTLAPATNQAIADIAQLQKLIKDVPGLKPFHIRKIEQQRQRLNALIGSAQGNDKRQVTILKRAFDDALDSAIDNALFQGDDQALDALKNARSMHRQYMQQFARNDATLRSGKAKDMAGDYMERMISANPTDEEIANWMFGASRLGGRSGSAQFAQRVKSVVGEGSPEWSAIRQAAFLKLTAPNAKGDLSGRMFLSRLNEATKGSGETFMKTLFSPDEIASMRRLANAVIRAQPEPGNPSRTAYKLTDIVAEQTRNLARALGFNLGGPVGAAGAEVGIRGAGAVGGLRKALEAQRANSGPMRPLQAVNVARAGAPGMVAAENHDSPPGQSR